MFPYFIVAFVVIIVVLIGLGLRELYLFMTE
jgi:hypothetical protein